MILEERIYRIRSGQMSQYLALVREEGLAIQQPILGHLIGYFVTEIGPLSHVVHMWAYQSFEERQRRRQLLALDPRWQAFIPRLTALIEDSQNRILLPTDFSPLQ
ncbi:NIPSNAP family protein [Halotalea alkalilenta]|uniref:NIPSNAP domain containing protein n=1 Tax=Halotalea alkalilenta TaxID=376489 RepID=A0A172YHU0_9GAMM|nr:NIPSNAP family protein [Halotalea alkalilenta]ANF58773.1 NIPSNAP domain containing protein [Halotalea alkalilenta]